MNYPQEILKYLVKNAFLKKMVRPHNVTDYQCNDINVENCLLPKWLLCASVSDGPRYRAAVAVKKYYFSKKKLEKTKKLIFC